MTIKDITEQNKEEFNKIVNHPLQSYQWGEFRKKTGVKVIRKGLFENEKIIDGFQLTIHKIPKTPLTIGYLPRGNFPKEEILRELQKIGKEEKCIFIQIEPNIEVERSKMKDEKSDISHLSLLTSHLKPSFHPLFTKYTFILDLTKSEEELLKNMHSKTRYNIKVAQKHGVQIIEDNSSEASKTYLKLTKETTSRQKFYAHTEQYHKLLFETLKKESNKNELTYHLIQATYKPITNNKEPITLVSWVLFIFKDTLYYPYGASSSLFKETMASNLMMWEAIKFGKKLGLIKFDMWGALGPTPDAKDPWLGFHRFKQGYGGELAEFVGSYDLIINPVIYNFYKIGDKLRWFYLKIRK